MAELAETLEQRDEINSVTYEPAENSWLQTRFAPDDMYVPFYRSGKVSIVSASSPEHFEKIVADINKLMSELLETNYDPTVEIANIIATAELGSIPPLEAIAIELGLAKTEYEPEQFPALIYRGGNCVLLIFSNGKIICTGLADTDRISSAIENVAEQIGVDTV